MKRCSCLVLVLCALGTLRAQEAPEQQPYAVRARALQAELAALGLEIDGSRLSYEVRAPEECAQDLDRQQDMFFPASYWEGALALRQALGLTDLRDPAALRRTAVGQVGKAFVAYYQPDRQALVFLSTALGRLAEQDHLLAHELTHAYQDQRFGLRALLQEGEGPGTSERSQIVHAIMEGHAECAALRLLLARKGKTLADVDTSLLEDAPPNLLSTPDQQRLYLAGTRFLLERYRAGGWEAVEACFQSPPSSSEQLLHPEKLGQDLPVTVSLPRAPGDLRRVHRDVLGEMNLRGLLESAGVERHRAALAASGWDGDLLDVYRGPRGRGFIWRSVWDRERDAGQVVEALRSVVHQGVMARGRVVDWVWAERPADQAILEAAARTSEFDPGEADPADGRSTATVELREAERRGQDPRVEAERWVLPEAGLSFPIPQGWHVRQVRGVQLLMREPPDDGVDFTDNLNVLVLPAPTATLADVADATRQQLSSSAAFQLLRLEQVELQGQAALRCEYQGTLEQGTPLRFLAFVFLRRGQQQVLTFTAARSRYQGLAEEFQGMVDGLRLLER